VTAAKKDGGVRPRVRVVAAVLPRGDAVLVQRRRPDESRGLLWEFPGGKVVPGEDDRAALARECREELGVEVEVGALLGELTHDYPDLTVNLAFFECALVSGEPRAVHAHEVRFVRRAELPFLPFCEADVPFVRRLAGLMEP
jgi:8-oxo-dGTP diphosphatase